MSIKNVPVLVCDGCGAVIDMDYYIHVEPSGQKVLPRDPCATAERDFCCEACQSWWTAQYPVEGPWGPAWADREWWREKVNAIIGHTPVRTAHEDMPLVDTHAHFDDPEPVRHE